MYSQVLVIVSVSVAVTLSIRRSKYANSKLCFTEERKLKGCMTLADDKPVSGLRCAMTCSERNQCEGYSLDLGTSKCYTRTHCPSLASVCPITDGRFRSFDRLAWDDSCLNGGFWDVSFRACVCVHSFAGLRCERRAESCEEVFEFGYPSEMLESIISPYPSLAEFRTYCSRRQIDTLTYVSLYTGSGKFDRGWLDYVKGFADNTTGKQEFWLGLDNIRYLTTRAIPQDLVINVTLSPPVGVSSSFTLVYTQFSVGNANDSFRYIFVSFSSSKSGPMAANSSLNSCLGPPSGIGFSTPDADHDNDLHPNANAASMSRSGWWYFLPPNGGPPPCNPFGLMFLAQAEPGSPKHMKLDFLDLPRMYDNKILVEVFLRSRVIV